MTLLNVRRMVDNYGNEYVLVYQCGKMNEPIMCLNKNDLRKIFQEMNNRPTQNINSLNLRKKPEEK